MFKEKMKMRGCRRGVEGEELKEPGPIASDFLQTLWDFGIRKMLTFFSLPLVNFTAEKMYCLQDVNENVTSYSSNN